jgi:hypothetical protein
MQCSLSVMCVRAAGSPRCSGFTFSQIGGMMWAMANVRLIKHEAVPKCGSFEVRFPDRRPSQYFYWEDLPGRRLRQDMLTSDVALEQAKALARAEQARLSAHRGDALKEFADRKRSKEKRSDN